MLVRGLQYRQGEEEGRSARELRMDRSRGVLERGGEVAGCGCVALKRYP